MKTIRFLTTLLVAVLFILLLCSCSLDGDLSGAASDTNGFSVTSTDGTKSFGTFDRAWQYANTVTDKDVTIVCNKNAELFNATASWNTSATTLWIQDRTGSLTVDLNGHSISKFYFNSTNATPIFDFCGSISGEFIIKNGTVTGGKSKRGGAFCLSGKIKFTAEKVTFKNNQATDCGGALYIYSDYSSTATLKDCTFTDNSSSNLGGAIYVGGSDAKVILNNVTVSNNTCTGNGAGGIHWAKDNEKMAEIILSGKIVIIDNHASNCCDDLMVTPYPANTIKMKVDNFSYESIIGLAFEYNATGTIMSGLGNDAERLSLCFKNEVGDALRITGAAGYLYFEKNVVPADAKASVSYEGKTYYYNTFAQAWATANAWNKKNCTFTLLADWVANENGSFDDNGGYGENGFGFYKNMLNPRDRGDDGGDKNSWLVIDLNNHTINKNLYSAGNSHNWKSPVKNNRKDNGRIFYFDDIDSNINVEIKNGTLRGGNTEDEGGAIYIDDEDVNLKLTNMLITDNCSEEEGSAIWVDICDSVTLTDVTVEYNYSDDNSQATCAVCLDDGDFYMYGVIYIRENYGKKLIDVESRGHNNLVLGDCLESVAIDEKSEIYLTDITTEYYSGTYLIGEDYIKNGNKSNVSTGKWHFRSITNTYSCYSSQDFEIVSFTPTAFKIDKELWDRGYYLIGYIGRCPATKWIYTWGVICD